MRVQSIVREVSRLYGVTVWCGGQPRKNSSHIEGDSSQQVHLPSEVQVLTILQNAIGGL